MEWERKGRLDQSRGKESRGEISYTAEEQSYRRLRWLCTSQKADPLNFLGDGLAAWTQSVELVLLLAQSWYALAEKVDEGHTKVLNAFFRSSL